ncbi:MAG: hypothetical protein ABF665_09080, partial [Gluconacetobacter sp.]
MTNGRDLAPVLDRVDRTLEASLERLFDFLRIPSISAQPAHAGDCRRAGAWGGRARAGLGGGAPGGGPPGPPRVGGTA